MGMEQTSTEGYIAYIVDTIKNTALSMSANFLIRVKKYFNSFEMNELQDAVELENKQRAAAYIASMTNRLQEVMDEIYFATDLSKEERLNRWQKAIEIEKRNLNKHVEATQARQAKAEEFARVYEESPEGAIWVLGNGVKEHTPDCSFMGGKAWAWNVLSVVNPINRHFGCACSIKPIPEDYKERIHTFISPEDWNKYFNN
jgi:hypothetical protein